MTSESRIELTAARRGSGSAKTLPAELSAGLTAGLFLGCCWWILSNGSPESWLIGMPALAAAVWARMRLRTDSKTRLSMGGLARFVPFFLWESLRGGIDVVRRTFAQPIRVDPGFIHYRTRLETPAARTFFANFVGLLPGTLAADLKDDLLEIHALDLGAEIAVELRRLEAAVERLFPQAVHGR